MRPKPGEDQISENLETSEKKSNFWLGLGEATFHDYIWSSILWSAILDVSHHCNHKDDYHGSTDLQQKLTTSKFGYFLKFNIVSTILDDIHYQKSQNGCHDSDNKDRDLQQSHPLLNLGQSSTLAHCWTSWMAVVTRNHKKLLLWTYC